MLRAEDVEGDPDDCGPQPGQGEGSEGGAVGHASMVRPGCRPERRYAVAGAWMGPPTGSPPRLIRAPTSGKISVERIAAPTRPAAVELLMCPSATASVVIATTNGSSVAE